MLQVYLVRHGETQWNAERRIQGQSDSPLTAKGEQQAMQVATRAKELGISKSTVKVCSLIGKQSTGSA